MPRRPFLPLAFLALMLVARQAHSRQPLTDSLDVRVSSSNEAESSVFVSPLNPNTVLVSNNLIGGGGQSGWISIDGGRTWTHASPVAVSGDPAAVVSGNPAFAPHGRFVLMGFLGASQGTNYKNTPGASWNLSSVTLVAPTDKGHIWVDNSPFSDAATRRYNLYAAWTDDGFEIDVSKSINGSVDWAAQQFDIQHVPSANPFNWGVNIQTGRTGRVYLMWSKLNAPLGSGAVREFGFSELFQDNPLQFTPEISLLLGTVHDANPIIPADATTYPSMAVDRSDPSGDHIFVVWADRTSSSRSDVLMMKGFASSAGSPVSWETTNLIRVNLDATALRWWPWISWDECAGMLAVVFMERIGSSINTKVATSVDRGVTWTELRVSDVAWDGTVPTSGYDYIGIGTGDGRAFPVWSDNRDNPGTSQLRPYTSPLLLWGVGAVSIAHVDHGNGTMTVTATWTTNLTAAPGDQLVLTSPSGIQHLSPECSACSTPDGKTHTLSFTVACEPGKWKYTVSSKRGGCIQKRASDVDSFFVEPNLQLSGVWTPIEGGTFACPAGGFASRFTATVDFQGNCVAQVAANRLALEALPIDQPKLAFFPQNQPQPATGPATAANGYMTTIEERQAGGCGSDSADVYLDGVAVAKVYVPFVPNLDLNGEGTVNASDLAVLSASNGRCPGHPSYNPCANFSSPDPCVNAAEVAVFASHLGHSSSNPLLKSGEVVAAATELRIEPQGVSGFVDVTVGVDGLQGRSAFGVVLRPTASKLQFARWTPRAEHATTTFAVDAPDAEGARLVLLAWEATPDASGTAELGTLTFATSSSDVALSDFAISYEDVASYDAAIASNDDPAKQSSAASPWLDQNRPNPFNPNTSIRYTLSRDTQVHLAIFDVAGRAVRVLVDERQTPGEYAILWDGRDQGGRSAGSGIYLYRLRTADFMQTRKLVLVR